jgi:antitoxin Phd
MPQTWQLQEAKNRFSRVVEDAVSRGPQIITKRGVEVAIVISYEEYQKMLISRGPLSEFFQRSPLAEVDLELTRDGSEARRDVEL